MRGTEAHVGSPKAFVRKKMAKRTMEDMKPLLKWLLVGELTFWLCWGSDKVIWE